jgi:hypothetical protein
MGALAMGSTTYSALPVTEGAGMVELRYELMKGGEVE